MWSRVGARTGTLKNPTKCLWRWEPDRRSNFFFRPPARLCAVTYMTEISLIVTLNNQFTSPQKQTSRIKSLIEDDCKLMTISINNGIYFKTMFFISDKTFFIHISSEIIPTANKVRRVI